MLRLNKKMEYGILALLYLDEQPNRVASVREISGHFQIPLALLSKVMQAMKGDEFVVAVHGNQGGYRLSKGLAEINLLQLNRSLAGPVHLVECLDEDAGDCRCREMCPLTGPMHRLNQRLANWFEATSLESLRSGRNSPAMAKEFA